MNDALHDLSIAPAPFAGDHRHAVQFYEDDGFLCHTVAEFVFRALSAHQPALVIATGAHRDALIEDLAARGVEIARVRMSGLLTLLDAGELLDRFMVGGMPDEALFRATVGEALDRAARGREGATVRAFGEMVDLLWRAGKPEAAIRLEVLWNDLAKTYPFSLLCAYSIGNFERAEDADAFLQICGHHDHVVPTERSMRLEEGDRLRRMTILEQRAQALETELEYRRRLEGRLRAALAEATAANQVKSEFLAVMSHELRTPLNAIGGYVELLEMEIRGPVTEAQREDLRRIQQSQRHLLGLVNDVLNYAKLESGTVQYEVTTVPVLEALHAAAALVAPLARAKGIRFEVVPCDAEMAVSADPEKLRQVLANLLSNAVKFTERGGRVTLGCEPRDGAAFFTVRDSGIGIAADKLEKIFEPFVQVRSDLTREHGGTGLGLAISRSIAEAMAGSLTVESVAGAGSTFTLRLPLADSGPT
ncbi:MAG TPA: ATP-binding protein [Longimicrobium sp.]|nr:ATP-binding protein [Longimicrobium sp.]